MPAPFAAIARDHGTWLIQAAAAAALELGLWDALVAGRLVRWSDQQTIAPHRLDALLRVLALRGHARRGGDGRWQAGRTPDWIAVPRTGWGQMAEVFRSGVPLLAGPVPGDPGEVGLRQGYHDHLWEQARAPAAEVATAILRGQAKGGHLLDLGAGSGAWTDAYLRADPGVRATVVDCAPVLDIAHARLAPWQGQTTFEEADLRTRAASGTFDVVLLVHVLHLYPPHEAADLVLRAAGNVAPGGRLFVIEMDLDADRLGPAASVLFDLDLALHTDGGRVHRAAEVLRWVEAAGLVAGDGGRLETAPQVAVVIGHRGP